MFHHQAYGLRFRSCLRLDVRPSSGEPASASADPGTEADVRIRPGALEAPAAGDFRDGRYAHVHSAEEIRLAWRDLAVISVRAGREVVVDATDAVETNWLRQCILGPALGLLLHQRGLFVLHASAVAMPGGATVFVGHKGAGKSTTAAALHARGHSLVADDVVALRLNNSEPPQVLPGFPQIKLWPDAAESVGVNAAELYPLHSKSAKRVWRPQMDTPTQPVRLRHLYVLVRGEQRKAKRLTGKEAFSELARHVYAPRFIEADGMTPALFRACTALTQDVPVTRLMRTASSQIADVVNAVAGAEALDAAPS